MDNIQPTQIAILGGSGDLAKRKLIPALIDLYVAGQLPKTFQIVGLARTPRSTQEYQQFVADALSAHAHNHPQDVITKFCTHFTYVSGSFDDFESYQKLKDALRTFDEENGLCTNKLFYLAVPPEYYEIIFKNIDSSKLSETCSDGSWARILVEKPFGSDLTTAQKLDTLLSSLFKEEQIFRIDHYLAKESVQNILSFRFANTLLRSSWNKESIEKVHITMHESLDVQNRGSFYDSIGALRDVGQNHLLQLLALIAMDEPSDFTATEIRKERANILKSLIPITGDTLATQVVRGQYDGYIDTRGVAQNSQTETFFAFTAYLRHKKWKGVPFHIEAGKALIEKKVTIEVFFRSVTSGPFQKQQCNMQPDKITLTLLPTQEIQITLNAKKPGLGYILEQQTLSFSCGCESDGFGAYQKVLLDCIMGDHTLFTQTDEVLASWKFITSIIDRWQNLSILQYKKGSWGPNITNE